MCGIIARAGQVVQPVSQSCGLTMLAHRGPDNADEWTAPSGQAWLGHRRLSIVDLSRLGNQPMHNEDHSIWLVANGEIYNSPALRIRLEGLGHHFYSHSDNETILHAYEAWGEQCLDYLQGMFAFVLWDEKRQKLLAARDPVGIKPLYYAQRNGRLLLASEAQALIKLLEHPPAPEPRAIAYMMTLGYIPSPWSIWQDVWKLEPGHFLTWQPNQLAKIRSYWEPPRVIDGPRLVTRMEFQERFEPILKEHLLADVPIGLFLSGGLDSSTLAAGLHEIGQLIQAMTISFPQSPQDEAPVAKVVAQHLNFEHQVIPLEVEDVGSLLRQVANAFDEPQGYSALLSLYLISQVAAQDFKVVLAGDGGDELFGGYTWYQNINDALPRTSFWLRQVLRPIVRRNASPSAREKAARHFSQASPLHRHVRRLYPRFLPEEAEALLAPTGLRFGDKEMLAPLQKHFEPKLPLRRALQRVDLMTFCTDSILAKVDRASMAHSLEVRVPFLDRRMIEWALPRPVETREQVESKLILRDYLRSRVPALVLDHPKQGFSLPILKGFDWQAALESIGQGPWVQQGYWSAEWERLLEPGVPERNARIWNLLVLTRWAEGRSLF